MSTDVLYHKYNYFIWNIEMWKFTFRFIFYILSTVYKHCILTNVHILQNSVT